MSEFVMSFGKHRGKSIEDVPSSYLRWVMENCDDTEALEAAENEYNYRTDHSLHFEEN